MRAQNALGPHLYDNAMSTNGDISHILWYKSIRGLLVPRKGRWHKPHSLTHADLVRANNPGKYPSWKRRIGEVRYLLEGSAVHAPRGNNSMRHYSQATLTNTEQGQVFLGFNAISPFEQNLNNTATKRFMSKKLKTGIEQSWLARLGNKDNCPPRITHWENFKKEYEMFAAHDLSYNAIDWRHLVKGSDLNTDTQPSMVAVLEGGHVLQHLIFPNDVSYDLEHRTRTEEKTLVERLLDPQVSRPTYGRMHSPEVQAMLAKLGPAHAAFMALDYLPRPRPATWASDLRGAENLERSLVDELLLLDLRQRVAELKHLKGPPVKMVVVSHLSYNGMMGPAPALDDGGFLSAILAQKVYNIRVSEDRSYLRQWRGLFFTVPGVNKFGSALMRELLTRTMGNPASS
ncbi:MAG: hypothetical protein IPP33_15000 [Flavobacteriales bacterium]|nr:hypothetical protein [Flavobacteriales bacterium]